MTAIAIGGLLLGLLAVSATTAAPSAAATVWLCKPGSKSNPCAVSRASTALLANGSTRIENPGRRKAPTVDCFYVYPTVSTQPTGNSNLTIESEQVQVARDQASRFSSRCRLYAPMYRQLTMAGSMLQVAPPTTAPNPEMAYRDVLVAWREYLRKYNGGRGVILIGHSQGSKNLTRLIQEEIDRNDRVRRKLVSAMIIGGGVLVPEGRSVGGSFSKVPACRRSQQIGCVVAYNTYASAPPFNGYFGITLQAGMRVLCVDPNGLIDGARRAALPYLPTARLAPVLPIAGLPVPSTRWVSLPGIYSTRCESNTTHTWLQADDVGPPGDPRPRFAASLGARFGLHNADINLSYGALVRLAGIQAAAWKKARKR